MKIRSKRSKVSYKCLRLLQCWPVIKELLSSITSNWLNLLLKKVLVELLQEGFPPFILGKLSIYQSVLINSGKRKLWVGLKLPWRKKPLLSRGRNQIIGCTEAECCIRGKFSWKWRVLWRFSFPNTTLYSILLKKTGMIYFNSILFFKEAHSILKNMSRNSSFQAHHRRWYTFFSWSSKVYVA